MSYSIKQIHGALKTLCILGGEKQPVLDKLDQAKALLSGALEDLNGFEVAGRGAVDTLLGCMLALESLVGKEDADG